MLAFLSEWTTAAMTWGGYWGFFLIAAAENFIFPIPSELVLPFAGFLIYQGSFAFWPAVFVSVAGAVVGSLASYALGAFAGRPFVDRFGKWFLLSVRDLDRAHAWFEKHGSLAVFICRFIPGVRQVFSIPAGAARMPLLPFIIWTAVGAFVWNASLIGFGWWLGPQWTRITHFTKVWDVLAILAVGALALYWWRKHGRELLRAWRSGASSRTKR